LLLNAFRALFSSHYDARSTQAPLNGNTLGEVSGLVYVAASADGYVVGEEWRGTTSKEEFGGLGFG